MSPATPLRRVAIVSGAFDVAYSYQENVWAVVLARRGVEVTVYTAGDARESTRVVAETAAYALETFPFRGSDARQLYLAVGVADAVSGAAPDVILWFGPPQLFGRDLADHPDLAQTPLITFMGQNRRMQAFAWWGRRILWRARAKAAAYRLLRAPTVVAACLRAEVVVTNTAETADIILGFVPRRHRAAVANKITPTPLGYDAVFFAYDAARRVQAREALGYPEDAVVAVASSRFAADKAETIRFNFGALTAALGAAPGLQVMMVGAGDDGLSREIRAAAAEVGARVRVEGFAGCARLADLFHAADVAVFSRPSISCQEALGTGAYGVFADDGSMTWLLDGPDQGRLFATGAETALTAAVVAACEGVDFGAAARAQRAALAARLSYDHIVDQVLARAGLSTPRRS